MRTGQTRVLVEVAKNRRAWVDSGYWEKIGERKSGEPWRFAVGWNDIRVAEVRAYLDRITASP